MLALGGQRVAEVVPSVSRRVKFRIGEGLVVGLDRLVVLALDGQRQAEVEPSNARHVEFRIVEGLAVGLDRLVVLALALHRRASNEMEKSFPSLRNRLLRLHQEF